MSNTNTIYDPNIKNTLFFQLKTHSNNINSEPNHSLIVGGIKSKIVAKQNSGIGFSPLLADSELALLKLKKAVEESRKNH